MSEEEKTPQSHRLSDLLPELLKENEARRAAYLTGKPQGPITGISKIDKALGYCFHQGVHLLQSAPGGGKTAFALQVAATCGFPCLYVSAEMGSEELFRRTIARTTNTFLNKLKTGELDNDTLSRLAHQTIEATPKLAITDATAAYIEPDKIEMAAYSLMSYTESNKLLIVMDSLQYWAKSSQAGTEYDVISAGLRSLSELASRLQSPILAISHKNREGNKGNSSGLHSGKGSGDLEYVAESVLELRPDKPDMKPDPITGETDVTLTIYKNRHGEVGVKVPLSFTGRTQTFKERS